MHGGSGPTCAGITGDLIEPLTKIFLFYCRNSINLHSCVALIVFRAKGTCCALLLFVTSLSRPDSEGMREVLLVTRLTIELFLQCLVPDYCLNRERGTEVYNRPSGKGWGRV